MSRFNSPGLLLKIMLVLFAAFCMSETTQAQAEIRVNNTSEYQGKGRAKWTIFIEAAPSTLQQIDSVRYRLDPAYGDNALRLINAPREGKYPFSTSGFAYESSKISITIFFRDKSQRRLPDYTLKLTVSAPTPPQRVIR